MVSCKEKAVWCRWLVSQSRYTPLLFKTSITDVPSAYVRCSGNNSDIPYPHGGHKIASSFDLLATCSNESPPKLLQITPVSIFYSTTTPSFANVIRTSAKLNCLVVDIPLIVIFSLRVSSASSILLRHLSHLQAISRVLRSIPPT
ncbi:hypothetical protein AB1N83_004219 [Pleurotus pulmonarius]